MSRTKKPGHTAACDRPNRLKHELAKALTGRKLTIADAIAKVRRAGLNGSEDALIQTLTRLEIHCRQARSPQAKNRIIYMMLAKEPKEPTEADLRT